MVKVGVAGGSGYGGLELIQLLLRHPEAELVWLSSEKFRGRTPGEVFPHLSGFLSLSFASIEELPVDELDVLFLALPHGEAMKVVPSLPESLIVIDLSGDFRIVDPEVFEDYYGFPHTAVEQQKEFVYGLSEINRDSIAGACRVANPGCFATASILALYPLYAENRIAGAVFVDSKTGSSGSGRTPSEKTHHPRRSQSLFPYKPFRHQHVPEMEQILAKPANPLVLQTYSTPLIRGIFASHYMQLAAEEGIGRIRDLFRSYYEKEKFVRWADGCPDVSAVQHSNIVDIGAAAADGFLTVWSTLDNLQKGAAGQAVQNMNISLGLKESLALEGPPAFP